MNPAPTRPATPKKRLFMIWLTALGLNCAVFAIYRTILLAHFGTALGTSQYLRVLGAGLRLDLTLLGFEFSLAGIYLLARRRVRTQRLVLGLWALTGFHAFACVANYSTMLERNQSFGELLLPYVTSPYQMYLAVMPFCQQHGWLMALLVAAITGYGWLGWRVSRRFEAAPADGWGDRGRLACALALALVPLLLTLHPVLVKKRQSAGDRGWKIGFIQSKHFTRFSQRACNHAVINPLLEFLTVQIPARWSIRTDYHLSEGDALMVWTDARGYTPADPRHPLLTTIPGTADSPLKNVVVIIVEGLSQSLIAHDSEGRPVTPFLRQLARDGIYFPDTFQNTNFTSGGVFSVLTGIPKISYEQSSERFASFEINGTYGTLPRILDGPDYTHYFCEGFRQSWDAFMAFTSNQGFEAHGYDYFKNALQKNHRPQAADSLLGIADHEFLQQCAELLLSCPTHFTAHCMTCTTHSPWAVPSGTPQRFENAAMNAFAYFDASLQAFCERLRSVPAVWNQTLLVVLGDHTSVTFGNAELERLRIPLIFYGPNLPKREAQTGTRASQIDVLPTLLGLLPGPHPCASLGRGLLDPAVPAPGILSGTTEHGLLLKDGYMLSYKPQADEFQLFQVRDDDVGTDDLSSRQPEVTRNLRRQFFSQIELAKRLAIEKRIFPFQGVRTRTKAATENRTEK
jgi:phosphoglycerol transferase MdoB-like AlkP superfamily enzyme